MELFLEDSLEMTKYVSNICVNFFQFGYENDFLLSLNAIFLTFLFRFQVDPNSPYAKPMKSSITPDVAGKKGQLTKDIQQIQESVSCIDFRPPDEKTDDQQLSEEQVAWRYASKGVHLISLPSCAEVCHFSLINCVLLQAS